MRYIIIPGFIVLFFLSLRILVGCHDDRSFTDVVPNRAILIDDIKSYQSIDEFKKFLSSRNFQWEEKKYAQSPPKGRPPFNIYTIKIQKYSHLGFLGKLVVSFFNNRLISTTFYPLDINRYIIELKKNGINFNGIQEIKIEPYTRVRFSVDNNDRKYIEWSDTRLDEEVELWIKRYS